MNTYASNEERGWMRDGPPRDKRATSARERERERERTRREIRRAGSKSRQSDRSDVRAVRG